MQGVFREMTKACAVICEYNPFHFGHKRQLERLREKYGTVVCLLGGDLTQRGEVAVADVYVRAQAAVACGADLVLELPAPWCCASAKDFASGGVSLAKGVGVDVLAFSAESDADGLREAARKREKAEARAQAMIRADGTLSYPTALERALGRATRRRPNDILAIEYLRAAERVGLPCDVLRREPGYASSTELRLLGVPSGSIPTEAEEALRRDPSFPRATADAGRLALAALRNRPESGRYGVPDELFARLVACAAVENDFDGLVKRCTNKVYTASRVRRAAWAVLFGFSPDAPGKDVPFGLLLAANAEGRSFLRRSAKKRTVPVVSRPSALRHAAEFRTDARVREVLRLCYGGDAAYARRPFLPGAAGD